MENLGFWNVAQRDPQHLAIVTQNGERITNGELLSRANQLVHGLRAQGFKAGDTIATVLKNEPAIVEIYMAIAQAGFYLVPINHHLMGPEIAYIIEDSAAKAFICSEEFAPQCNAAMDQLSFNPEGRFTTGSLPGFRSFDELKEGQPTGMPGERRPGTIMNYTSGTTGKPKGVRRPIPTADPATIGAQLGMFLMLFGIQPGGGAVHLCGSPLYHTAVLNFVTYSLHLGHSVVIMEKWTPEEMLRVSEEHRVTHTHMVPTQFHRLLKLPEEVKERYDLSSYRHVIHGAAPCPTETKRRMMEWWGPVIYEYYAASEGGGTLLPPDQFEKKPGSVGLPWPISQIKIVDDDRNECEAGDVGTVYIKMGDIEFEYHGAPDKTKDAWLSGFFTVGDAGYLDQDGYLYLCDRKADMIISGGANIYPAETEAVLHQHLKVVDVAVFGIPHDDWGEEVKAVVELEEGLLASSSVEAELIDYCRENLAHFKCPKSVDFITTMPRDPNGKLQKRKLRDPYWEGHGGMI